MKPTTPFILLADDDPDDRLLMRLSFETMHWGNHVTMLTGGKETIAYLNNLAWTFYPSLIVLDYNMPDMNGAQVLRLIKTNRQLKYITVVVYSTNMPLLLKEQLKALGALNCYHKPSTYNEMLALAKVFKEIAEGKFHILI